MTHIVYEMVRFLFFVLIRKGLIEDKDINEFSVLCKEYESKRMDNRISTFKASYNINKLTESNKKEFEKLNQENSKFSK